MSYGVLWLSQSFLFFFATLSTLVIGMLKFCYDILFVFRPIFFLMLDCTLFQDN